MWYVPMLTGRQPAVPAGRWLAACARSLRAAKGRLPMSHATHDSLTKSSMTRCCLSGGADAQGLDEGLHVGARIFFVVAVDASSMSAYVVLRMPSVRDRHSIGHPSM